jgi:hypothetical protein
MSRVKNQHLQAAPARVEKQEAFLMDCQARPLQAVCLL